MNLLMIDHPACGMDVVIKAQAAGHKVRIYMARNKEGDWPRVGEGIVEVVRDWEPSMKWADLVFLTDNCKDLRALDSYRKRGFPVFGPTWAGAELELDRDKGQEFLKDHGIETIPYEVFSNYDRAEKYVRASMKRYVSKPSGDADKALSYVSKRPDDMIYMLRRWKENNKLKGDFILQEFKEGTEIAVGGWLGPNGFLPHWFENFEHKKMMNDDYGPNVGEMGTIGKYTTTSRLAEKMLRPCEEDLVRLGIMGYVDINTIIDDEGNVWPMEFTVRPGWPTTYLQLAVTEGDPIEWMSDLLDGRDTLQVSEDIVTGVLLAIPDFPNSKLTKKELTGYPVYGTEEVEPLHLHMAEVMMAKAPHMQGDAVVDKQMYVTAGDYVLVTTGRGSEVEESVRQAYDNLDLIEMPNSPIVRTDIGEKVSEEGLPKLRDLGYCESWPK